MTPVDKYFSASDPLHAAKLFIDTQALSQNYLKLRQLCAPAQCAAVVKADAYGLGMGAIAPVLAQAGCKDFFVAQPEEGEKLRMILPNARIIILNGLYPDAEKFYLDNNLIPVLNKGEEIEAWAAYAEKLDQKLPALIHIDTGMNRLGLDINDATKILARETLLSHLDILYIMSHLACADSPDMNMNRTQLNLFCKIMKQYPDFAASLANSGGIINGSEYHFDLTRPGYALYGGRVNDKKDALMNPVVHLRSRFLQIRELNRGESVGYGATWRAKEHCLIGVLPIGYADGFSRLHGASDGEMGGSVYIEGSKVPIIGRVSMDLMAVDITKLASKPSLRNMSVEILGSNITIDDLAESAQTIGYEVLTSLGKRYPRHYAVAIQRKD